MPVVHLSLRVFEMGLVDRPSGLSGMDGGKP